jgi:hypothetical protein
MLRPIFIACDAPSCRRAPGSMTRYGFLDEGIAYVHHSPPSSNVARRKIFEVVNSNESWWSLGGRGYVRGGTQIPSSLEGGFNGSGSAIVEGSPLLGPQAIARLRSPRVNVLTKGGGRVFEADYVGLAALSRQRLGNANAGVEDSKSISISFRVTNAAKCAASPINALVLGDAYIYRNRASRTGVAGCTDDRTYTSGAGCLSRPLAGADSYLKVNQLIVNNTDGNNQTGAGDHVDLRNIILGSVVRQQTAARGANYVRRFFTTGLTCSSLKLSYAGHTSLKLSSFESNSRCQLAADSQSARHSFARADLRTEVTSLQWEIGRLARSAISSPIARCAATRAYTEFTRGKSQPGMQRKPPCPIWIAASVERPQSARRHV